MLAGAIVFPFISLTGLLPGYQTRRRHSSPMALAGFRSPASTCSRRPLTADIVDDDCMRTGMRREAMFFGAQNFVEKMVTALRPPVLIALLAFGNTAG